VHYAQFTDAAHVLSPVSFAREDRSRTYCISDLLHVHATDRRGRPDHVSVYTSAQLVTLKIATEITQRKRPLALVIAFV